MDYADLRSALAIHIKAQVPEVGNRLHSTWAGKADEVKPFLVMQFTGDLPSINTPKGLFMGIDVLVIGEEGNILAIDVIADKIVTELHKVDITTPDGRTIVVEYRRDARIDFWIEEVNGLAIRLAFWMPTDFWT